MNQAEKFRQTAAYHNQDRTRMGWRYSEDLRRIAIEYCRTRRLEGAPFAEIADDLDITVLTLKRWTTTAEESLKAIDEAPSFRPVLVSRPTADDRVLSVVMPNGVRIEGLSWEQTLQLAETTT